MKCLPFLIALTIISTVELASFTGCEDVGGPPPRIILNPGGPSIDGIHLGDSPEQVQRVLGPPERIGWADGIDRGWRLYGYGYNARERLVTLSVYFISLPGVEWGPTDVITVKSGYAGRTRDGLGIGSRRERVRASLGIPIRSDPVDGLGHSYDYYCLGAIVMNIIFDHDTVKTLSLGPLVPDSTVPRCK